MSNKCIKKTKVQNIKLEENNMKAIFINDERDTFEKIKVDDCLIKQEKAADWIISHPKKGSIIIELKGGHVEYGIEQINATMDFWKNYRNDTKTPAALIVCSKYPSYDTQVRKEKRKFREKYKRELKIEKNIFKGTFEDFK